MKLIVGFLFVSLLLGAPLAKALAAPKVKPVIDDEAFESNFKKGAQESVTLRSGKVAELHDDFTWEYATVKKKDSEAPSDPPEAPGVEPKTAKEAVEVWDTTFDTDEVDYSKAVRLFLHYKNNSSKRVVGVSVTVRISNSFGKLLYEFSKDDEAVVGPKEQMKNETYFLWKDNPYINGEPYDLMWQAAQNGTGKVTVAVRKVIFEDGKVLTNVKGAKK